MKTITYKHGCGHSNKYIYIKDGDNQLASIFYDNNNYSLIEKIVTHFLDFEKHEPYIDSYFSHTGRKGHDTLIHHPTKDDYLYIDLPSNAITKLVDCETDEKFNKLLTKYIKIIKKVTDRYVSLCEKRDQINEKKEQTEEFVFTMEK